MVPDFANAFCRGIVRHCPVGEEEEQLLMCGEYYSIYGDPLQFRSSILTSENLMYFLAYRQKSRYEIGLPQPLQFDLQHYMLLFYLLSGPKFEYPLDIRWSDSRGPQS